MSDTPRPHDDDLQESREKGYEVRDTDIPRVLLYGVGMLVLVVLAGAVLSTVVYKNMGWFLGRTPDTPQFQAEQEQLPPQPRLEVQGRRDLKELRKAEERQLESYGWVDRQRNIVRIPVTRAMEIMSRKTISDKQ